MRIGVYGGGFDPVHLGHLILAEHALQELPLDRVLFVPSGGKAYYKDGCPASGPDRLEMLRLALQGQPQFEICGYEVEQQQFCYTIDTLRHLRALYPDDSEIILLAGGDWIEKIPGWKEGERLMQEFSIAFFPRPGFEKLNPQCAPNPSAKIYILHMPLVDISSTQIRDRLRQGQPIDDLVPASVKHYIETHGLYRD